MLGRLKMSISECIHAYKSLSQTVFARHWSQNAIFKPLMAIGGRPWFSADDLKLATQNILEDRELDPNTLLKEEPDPTCKV
jgi:hypothetical protein